MVLLVDDSFQGLPTNVLRTVIQNIFANEVFSLSSIVIKLISTEMNYVVLFVFTIFVLEQDCENVRGK